MQMTSVVHEAEFRDVEVDGLVKIRRSKLCCHRRYHRCTLSLATRRTSGARLRYDLPPFNRKETGNA
jgi:hypothetical protein